MLSQLLCCRRSSFSSAVVFVAAKGHLSALSPGVFVIAFVGRLPGFSFLHSYPSSALGIKRSSSYEQQFVAACAQSACLVIWLTEAEAGCRSHKAAQLTFFSPGESSGITVLMC